MKKAVLAAGAFLALGVLCYVGPLRGQAQPPVNNPQAAAPPAAPLRTRIAILNLTYVIKNYDKYKRFQDEMNAFVEPFKKKDADLRAQLEKLRNEAGKLPRQAQPGQGEELEKQAREIQRLLEDNTAEIKLKLGSRSDDEMRILYQDICLAVQSYAASHDFDLVLQYNDAVTTQDFLSPQNIARKLNSGALMPLHFQRNMDISQAVADLLNYNVNATSAPATPQGAPPGGR